MGFCVGLRWINWMYMGVADHHLSTLGGVKESEV